MLNVKVMLSKKKENFMIEVKQLSKSYSGHAAIDDMSFKIKKGKIVGFLGPNGAGKTTTMKIITGFMTPTSGQALIKGLDVFECPLEIKKVIGYLPERPPVYLDMTVRSYITFVAGLRGVPKAELSEKVDAAIKKTNLQDVQERRIEYLSKGYQQRVGIAQAIVSDPEILILDEPTVGLDPNQVREIRELIKSLKTSHTVILSTHILSEVKAICDEVIIINKGKIVTQGSIDEITKAAKAAGTLSVQVVRPSESVTGLLKSVEGVTGVALHGNKYEISLHDMSEDIIERVSETLVSSKCGLVGLKKNEISLEDIFIQLTNENN